MNYEKNGVNDITETVFATGEKNRVTTDIFANPIVSTYTDKNGAVVAGGHDKADIYAVVYEVDLTPGAKFTPLNGDNVLTSDRIVMMARIDNPQEAEGTVSDGVSAESLARATEWVHFSEPFRLMDGKTFDTEKLEQNGYAITVVCTSSREGATFEGAVGSTLFVDELQIIYEDQ